MSEVQTYPRREGQENISIDQKCHAIIGKNFPEVVIPLIEGAKNKLKIIVFDWRWYPATPGCSVQKFSQAIFRAQKRNVKVQVIANHEEIIGALKAQGCEAKRLVTDKLVHTKLMLIDDQIVIIGSHNYTQSAFTINHEASVYIENLQCAAQFREYYDNLWLS